MTLTPELIQQYAKDYNDGRAIPAELMTPLNNNYVFRELTR